MRQSQYVEKELRDEDALKAKGEVKKMILNDTDEEHFDQDKWK